MKYLKFLIHDRRKFTVEIGDKELNFLDVIIINNNKVLEFDWYRKLTCNYEFIDVIP